MERPWSSFIESDRFRWGLVALLAIAQFTIYASTGALQGPWRIDETHKISETVFLRYLLEGDVDNEAWFCNRVERSNPPVGKYLLGLGILASGANLPDRPSLSTQLGPDFYVPPSFPQEISNAWLPALPAARATALAFTSMTGALIFLITARLAGFASGLMAWSVWVTNPTVNDYGSTATFDPILTLLFVASAVPLLKPGRSTAMDMVSSGVLAGFAIATRLSGALAILAIVPAILLKRDRLATLAIVLAAATLALFVVDPFLWATGVECETLQRRDNPANPFLRGAQRVQDLSTLTQMLDQRGAGEWSMSRAQFAIEHLLGSVPGLLSVPLALLSMLALYRNRALTPLVLWGWIAIAGMVVWMPYPWPRYLTIPAAGLAMLAGLGSSLLLPPWRPRTASRV